MQFAAETLDYRDAYRLLTGCIVPRPIAWVTTHDPTTGVVNLAPFSFFTVCSVEPPMVCFVPERRLGQKKDTLRNIEATGEFVVNIATEPLAQPVVTSGEDFPPEVSEVAETGLHLLPSERVAVPRLAETPVNMECRLREIHELGRSPHSLIIGDVLLFHVSEEIYAGGRADYGRFPALGRLGGHWYCGIDRRFHLKPQAPRRQGP